MAGAEGLEEAENAAEEGDLDPKVLADILSDAEDHAGEGLLDGLVVDHR